ncbi:unnamed protein product, partial [Ceratitis capitata]
TPTYAHLTFLTYTCACIGMDGNCWRQIAVNAAIKMQRIVCHKTQQHVVHLAHCRIAFADVELNAKKNKEE